MSNIIQEWFTKLEHLNYFSITIRLLLSVICSGLIGFERERNNQTAGLRTHILVCIGSCLAMMIGEFIHLQYPSAADPARIPAQVISGIGFLGVGTIIVTGGHVRGTTTAAGLWATACMGLAYGIGFYKGGLIAFAGIEFTLIIIREINKHYHRKYPRKKQVFLKLNNLSDLPHIMNLLRIWNVDIKKINIENTTGEIDFVDGVSIFVDIDIKGNTNSEFILISLLKDKKVLFAEYVEQDEEE